MQRIAAELGKDKLERSDFISRTLIPEKTIDFYIVSWPDALKEAGLGSIQTKENDISDAKLLEDLVRLHNRYGEIPTLSLIEDSGKYPSGEYTKRWRTLDEAMKLAKKKFPDFVTEKDKSNNHEIETFNSDSSVFNLDDTLVSVNRNDLILNGGKFNSKSVSENKKKRLEINEENSSGEDSGIDFRTDNVNLDNLISEIRKKKKKVKIIPKTVKPIRNIDKVNFRGLKSPPSNKGELMLIFGIVCEELSFMIEQFPQKGEFFRAKRKTGDKSKTWESIIANFSLRSSDAVGDKSIIDKCDILICWKNDWLDCPLEVLELSKTLTELENYSPELE